MLEYLTLPYFRNALIGVVLLSIVAGIIGTYIVSRRLVAISGGITHTCFGGLGLGNFLGINPLVMAAVFAVGASLGVEWMSQRRAMRQDTAIAVVWALGMALGVLFVSLTPGYVPELTAFLFGTILMIGSADLWAIAIYAMVLGAFFMLCHRKIVICAFDSDFAAVAGLRVRLINYTMTVLVAIGIVLAIRMVGIMLLMSMLSLPQLIAEQRYHRFASIMWASIAVSLMCSVGSLMLCTVVDVPCSAVIVIVMVGVYIVASGCNALAKHHRDKQ